MSRRGVWAKLSSIDLRRSPCLGGLGHIRRRRRRLGRNVFEVFLDQRERSFGFEIADQCQHRVVRRVMVTEKRRRVFDRRRIQIRHGADSRVFISKVVVGQIDDRLVSFPIGPIVIALAPFLLDGQALVIEVRLGNRRRAHAVGFEKNSQFQLIRR